MPYTWTAERERQMLLLAISSTNLRPSADTWTAVATLLGEGLSPSAVSQKYYKLRNESTKILNGNSNQNQSSSSSSSSSSSFSTPTKRKAESSNSTSPTSSTSSSKKMRMKLEAKTRMKKEEDDNSGIEGIDGESFSTINDFDDFSSYSLPLSFPLIKKEEKVKAKEYDIQSYSFPSNMNFVNENGNSLIKDERTYVV